MRVEIFVQARMGSSRLPGKVMAPILGRPLLEYLMERLQRVKEADAIVILTTTHPRDDAIEKFCQKKEIPCYRGSEEDVLDRYYTVAMKRRPDAIVRITSDCPLIDPTIVDEVISIYKKTYPRYDYISNSLERSYPRGLDTEVFSLKALSQAFYAAQKKEEREHVTVYIYTHPEQFHLKNMNFLTSLAHHRWTVDTPEDLTLIELIIENLYPLKPNFVLSDVLHLLHQHPEWEHINSHIEQKPINI